MPRAPKSSNVRQGLRRGDTGSAQVRVHCPPETAWQLVGDVTRIPEWSPECFRVRLRSGRALPAHGARFRGWNRNRAAIWATTCRIDELVPQNRLSFTMVSGGEYTRWTWTVEPDRDGGCIVTQRWEMLRDLPAYAVAFERYLMGVHDRRANLQQNIERGLARVKAALEGEPVATRPGRLRSALRLR